MSTATRMAQGLLILACMLGAAAPGAALAKDRHRGAGFGMCLDKGYSPSDCARDGSQGYGRCIQKGYSPMDCE